MIWVHRGQPDRRAVRAALDGLAENRMVALAPEGHESQSGGLEEGTQGAAYLALKSDAPVIPVTFTGTENKRIYPNMKRLRRTPVTVTIGPPFRLSQLIEQQTAEAGTAALETAALETAAQKTTVHKTAIEQGTRIIMQTLAQQLPANYRGIYRLKMEKAEMEKNHGS